MSEQQIRGNVWKWDSVPSGCGVIAIRRKSDGRSYYVAASDMRQRAYDAVMLLRSGKHHNPELQAAWTATPDDFQITAVELVRHPNFLAAFKQAWIERGNCFRQKPSLATHMVTWPSR